MTEAQVVVALFSIFAKFHREIQIVFFSFAAIQHCLIV